MGQCYAKNIAVAVEGDAEGGCDAYRSPSPIPATVATVAAASSPAPVTNAVTPAGSSSGSPWPSPYPRSAAGSPLPSGIAPSPARSTPRRFFRRPPSPAKHIKASLAKRFGRKKPSDASIPEDGAGDGAAGGEAEAERQLDKSFGYEKNLEAKYEIGKEVGKGHFGNTCLARAKKGELKGQLVAIKIISKVKMTTAIAIEDVRREVKILKFLSGHANLVKFYEAYEDDLNVYIIMEGGRYKEKDAKVVVIQILSVIAFCHLQGVVHRDLKPENFLFTTKDENAPMKIIDFGLSDFIRPGALLVEFHVINCGVFSDERLNDIVGSAYYVAPEVLHRSYSTEADMWSIGVITYILLCGSRPFWAQTESGIFRSVLRADPNFEELPWPAVSLEAKDFVRRLLNKDYRKRMSAAKALSHPWLRNEHRQTPLDIQIYKSVKSHLRTTTFRRAAMKALSNALTEDELIYIRSQFNLLQPNNDGCVSIENFRMALWQNATDAMKVSKVPDILNALEPLSYRRMNFEEFCVAAISPYQLEALKEWEQIATRAFQYFEEEGNHFISIEELAQEMNLAPAAYSMMRDWIRPADGKLSFLGFTKFLHGVTIRSSRPRNHH
ncbi:hypothetical protein ZIOFF_061295 [Zingiber officinale]|uniref:Protein kinase domain-containing protein n=1 Tax=Zingiber officinale TaxID=94328 RepID=A0A8J5F463_ZINOF|nr:hypothetical protein ZIOFF_061295 [Zingiber officinale]